MKTTILLLLLLTSCAAPNQHDYTYHMVSHVMGDRWDIEDCHYCDYEHQLRLRAHTVIR